jgi:hypothetical protein
LTSLVPTEGPEPQQPKAAQWFQNPIQKIAVKVLGAFSATADGACPVELEDGDRAYVKPRADVSRNLVVAREKIASDLGYLLELPVAPVVVRLPDPPDWAHHSAMSLAALAAARLWSVGGQAHLATAAEMLETLRVFWTWIGDADHNGHGQNLLFVIRSGKCEVMAIDHGQSLCYRNQNNPLEVGVCQGYGTDRLPGREAWTRAAKDKILSLDWGRIESVVQRLHPILTGDEQARMIRILQKRRGHLATFLGL